MIKELEEIIKLQKQIDELNKEQIDLKHKKYNIEHSEKYDKVIAVLRQKRALEYKIKFYYDNFNKIKNKLNKICIPASIIITIIFLVLIFSKFLFIGILSTLAGMGLTYSIFKKSIEKEEKAIENVDIKKLEEEKEKNDEEQIYQEKINKTIKRKVQEYDTLCNLKKEKVEILKNKRDIIINNLQNKISRIGINEFMNNDDYSNINEKVKKYVRTY